ncbi:DUF3152 domain-containing protein [Actinomadura keratinilytica]|jgi:hypothetical protein|uniref:DUF3152 domain-containing protein n=1 Tax=Actinomadura keratinilytica TaxID=547461 RepID=A0ABP7Z392_9ACTN
MEPPRPPSAPSPPDVRAPGADPGTRDVPAVFDEQLERSLGAGRRRRAGAIALGVPAALLVAAAVVGIGAFAFRGGAMGGAASGAQVHRTTSSPAAGETKARVEAEPSPPAGITPSTKVYIPKRGTGKFTRPEGADKTFGRGGRLMRYMVEVEGGLRQDPAEFAREVDRILAHRRGWTASGRVSFRRVDSAPYDFVVRLASPGTTDKLCAAYGLDTEGKVNCAGGKEVVVNLRRWLLLTPYYKGKPGDYHALTINHEVGHRLGYGHATCPGKGRPAPVMQQQIFGLKGCVANPWPYDSKGRFITGPAVP